MNPTYPTECAYVELKVDECKPLLSGQVPRSAAALQRLPGVGPKIAHLVASAGPPDTHETCSPWSR